MSLGVLDLMVVVVYLALIAGIGLAVARGQNTTAKFFVAGRSMPEWVVAFTLMGTVIGTGTFIGHPGTSYQKGLILLLPHLLLPVVVLFVAKFIVPFYRRVVQISAYEYIGQRFGLGGRLYTSLGFLTDRTFDIGVTLVTAAIAVNVLTGWELRSVIIGIALFTATYTMLGGIKAVVWTDVVQGTILILAGAFMVGRLLFAPEAGAPFAVVAEAWRGDRLSFGSWEWSWHSLFDTQTTTVWLFMITYVVQWLRRYVTGQHLVQRYLIARTDAEASRAVFTGALICVPVFCVFMFIGSCLYGFFALAKVPGPELGDNIVPYFMAHYLPAGLLGLVVAAVLAAAMSIISSDLNSIATVATTDFFGLLFPQASDRARLHCGRVIIAIAGLLAAMGAMLLIPAKHLAPVMERAITIAAILSGGTLGLFTLGFATRSATRRGCYVGIACCLAFMTWAILSQPKARLVDFGFNFQFNPILIGVCGHLVLFTTGWAASRLLGGYRPENVEDLTFWSHKYHRAGAASSGVAAPAPQAAPGAASASPARMTTASPPNILLIVVDDMGVHQLGCYGSSFYETPRLDELARVSVRFSQAYGASPVCSPSRAALYTGRHPARLHLTNYIPGTEPPVPRLLPPRWRPHLPVEEVTIGDALKARGYHTAHFGKWHFAPDYNYRPGRPMDPESQGFDEVFVTRKPAPDADPEGDPHHIHEITDRAVRFITEPRTQPFLCVVAHNALHRPELAPAAVVGRFSTKPGSHHDYNRPVLAAMMAEVDRSVGRLLDALQNAGRDRDTLVIFTADHGAMGRSSDRKPLRGAKADLYEGGLRVPLLIHAPGARAGAVETACTQGADVFCTVLDAAGVPLPSNAEGLSLWPFCGGTDSSLPPRTLYWHYPHYHHLGLAPSGALRAGRWKLIEWFERTIGGANDGPPFELFDLETDPGETRNLAAEQPEICADLARRLAAWRREVGAQEMEPNPHFDLIGGNHVAPPPTGDALSPYGK